MYKSHVSQFLLEGLHLCNICVSVVVGRIMCMYDVCLSCCWKVYVYVRYVLQLLLEGLRVSHIYLNVVERAT